MKRSSNFDKHPGTKIILNDPNFDDCFKYGMKSPTVTRYLYQWPFIILSTKLSLKDPPWPAANIPHVAPNHPTPVIPWSGSCRLAAVLGAFDQNPRNLWGTSLVAGLVTRPFFEKTCCCFFGLCFSSSGYILGLVQAKFLTKFR